MSRTVWSFLVSLSRALTHTNSHLLTHSLSHSLSLLPPVLPPFLPPSPPPPSPPSSSLLCASARSSTSSPSALGWASRCRERENGEKGGSKGARVRYEESWCSLRRHVILWRSAVRAVNAGVFPLGWFSLVKFGSVLVQSWFSVGSVLVQFGSVLVQCWFIVGSVLVQIWFSLAQFGSVWLSLGSVWGQFRLRLVSSLGGVKLGRWW